MSGRRTPVRWIEQGYAAPGAFQEPVLREIHTPHGMFRSVPDHRGDCFCETGAGEIWTQASAAARWRGGGEPAR